MMIAANVARPGQFVVEQEAAHQEEVGSVKHLLQTSGEAAVSLKEAQLFKRRRLLRLSLLRERLLQNLVAAIRPVVGRQVQLGEQAVAERLRQAVLALLDQRFFANQRQQLGTALAEEALSGLRRRFEMPLQVRQSVPLDLLLARGLDLAPRNVRTDGVDGLLEAELVERKGRLLCREVDHQQAP